MKKVNLFLVFNLFLTSLFSNDISAIAEGHRVFEMKCLNCHNSKHQINLFDKKTFINNQKMLSYVVEKNIMPPWYADTLYSRFENEHILTDNEKNCLLEYLKSPQASKDKFKEQKTESLKPDLVIPIANGFEAKASNKDLFVSFASPYEIPIDTLVSCIEFVSNSKNKINHHFNYEIANGKGKLNYNPEIKSFVTGEMTREVILNEFGIVDDNGNLPEMEYFSGWIPGMSPTWYKPPFSIYLPQKGYIVTRVMHYAPSPITAKDSCYLNIYFNKKYNTKDLRQIRIFKVGTFASKVEPELFLEPNEKKWFSSSATTEYDMIFYSMQPHMHLLGRKFIAFATYNNDTLPLIKIDDWNFNFQENYVFKNPIVLRKGTTVHIKGYFDNSLDNIYNPSNPPVLVTGKNGMFTNGEMLFLGMQYLLLNDADLKHVKF